MGSAEFTKFLTVRMEEYRGFYDAIGLAKKNPDRASPGETNGRSADRERESPTARRVGVPRSCSRCSATCARPPPSQTDHFGNPLAHGQFKRTPASRITFAIALDVGPDARGELFGRAAQRVHALRREPVLNVAPL